MGCFLTPRTPPVSAVSTHRCEGVDFGVMGLGLFGGDAVVGRPDGLGPGYWSSMVRRVRNLRGMDRMIARVIGASIDGVVVG